MARCAIGTATRCGEEARIYLDALCTHPPFPVFRISRILLPLTSFSTMPVNHLTSSFGLSSLYPHLTCATSIFAGTEGDEQSGTNETDKCLSRQS